MAEADNVLDTLATLGDKAEEVDKVEDDQTGGELPLMGGRRRRRRTRGGKKSRKRKGRGRKRTKKRRRSRKH